MEFKVDGGLNLEFGQQSLSKVFKVILESLVNLMVQKEVVQRIVSSIVSIYVYVFFINVLSRELVLSSVFVMLILQISLSSLINLFNVLRGGIKLFVYIIIVGLVFS